MNGEFIHLKLSLIDSWGLSSFVKASKPLQQNKVDYTEEHRFKLAQTIIYNNQLYEQDTMCNDCVLFAILKSVWSNHYCLHIRLQTGALVVRE